MFRIPLLWAAIWLVFVVAASLPRHAPAQSARDYVYIVGSSTVYPFSTVVAERFGRGSSFRTPKVESTGSGGGIRLFCSGLGVAYPDIVNSSRRMAASEREICRRNGVRDVVEVRIGFDGILVANSRRGPELSVTREQLYRALARWVPGDRPGEVRDNPYERWSEIDAALPDLRIEVYGPPPTSGTRDAFVEVVLEAGCRQTPWIAELARQSPGRYFRLCHTVREDGRYIEAGENDNLIVQKLTANPDAFGILGFSFVDQNADVLRGAGVEGVPPEFDNIADFSYPISRPLYLYVKQAHIDAVPGLREYLAEFTAERSWGENGYLAYRGLVPLPVAERQAIAARIGNLDSLSFARPR